jgi:hypothetical protein
MTSAMFPRGNGDAVRRCAWCGELLPETAPLSQLYDFPKCRKSAWRLRCRRQTDALNLHPLRFCYADPPYPGLAKRYYGKEETYAGEVDHAALISELMTYDGWALSTSARALRDILPLCPPGVHVLPWCKPNGVSSRTRGLHNAWEALIVKPGRELAPGKRDFLIAKPARGGGTLMGRKPIAFCAFLFDAGGLLPGDTFVDKFPGTGIVGRAFASLRSSGTRGDETSSGYRRDGRPRSTRETSLRTRGDARANP